ncbi:MAG: carbon storage regulator [Motiliproteus sp.]
MSMLTITRKESQTVTIGDDVVVTASQTRRGSVRLNVEAPKDVTILRGELKDHRK